MRATSTTWPGSLCQTLDIERLTTSSCLAGRHDGDLTVELIRFHVRYLSAPKEADKRLNALAEAGFVIRDGQSIRLRDWAVRQYKSDSSTPRVQDCRARQLEQANRNDAELRAAQTARETLRETRDVTFHETLQETLHEPPPQRRGNDPPPVSETATETPLQIYRVSDRSSSSVGTRSARSGEHDDDDDLKLVKKKLGDLLSPACSANGLIRALVSEGCELEVDVIPAIKDRALALKPHNRPLRTLTAPWVAKAAREFRDRRLQSRAVKGVRPATVFVANSDPRWPALQAAYRVINRKMIGPPLVPNPERPSEVGWHFKPEEFQAAIARQAAPNTVPKAAE